MHRVFIILLLLTACVEPFEFSRNNLDPQLIIEAYVSDLSYNESLDAPSDGRFFIVKLKYSQPVDKFLGDRITPFAEVKLIDDLNNEWTYVEGFKEWGTYFLPDKEFKARNDRMYKLQITTHNKLVSHDKLVYESGWEKLPSTTSTPVEEIWFEEDERKNYYYAAGEKKIKDQLFINVSTSIPINSEGEARYYKWEYSPMWVYEAPLALAELRPYKKCWVTSPLYLNHYVLQEDVIGGSDKVLFNLTIENNNRLYKSFSVLIFQQSISKDYFNFLKSMKEQTKPNGIFDTPPANLPTNFTCINDPSKKPVGYFGVINESTKRWYFNKDDLSYYVQDNDRKDCLVKYNRPQDPPDYAPECLNCLAYTEGDATLFKPSWWKDN